MADKDMGTVRKESLGKKHFGKEGVNQMRRGGLRGIVSTNAVFQSAVTTTDDRYLALRQKSKVRQLVPRKTMTTVDLQSMKYSSESANEDLQTMKHSSESVSMKQGEGKTVLKMGVMEKLLLRKKTGLISEVLSFTRSVGRTAVRQGLLTEKEEKVLMVSLTLHVTRL